MNEEDLNARMMKRYRTLHSELQEYIIKFGAANYAYISAKLLGKAIIDYMEDIERLKAFEGMSRINEAKIYAYQTYWLLRRKPVQIINSGDIPEVGNYLNEYICAALLVAKMYREVGVQISDVNEQRLRFIRLLVYNFKYRTYTQKSLELMIEAFMLQNKQ